MNNYIYFIGSLGGLWFLYEMLKKKNNSVVTVSSPAVVHHVGLGAVRHHAVNPSYYNFPIRGYRHGYYSHPSWRRGRGRRREHYDD